MSTEVRDYRARPVPFARVEFTCAMVEHSMPGVFVEETSFRSHAIEGVSTSVAAFVGPTLSGPVGSPSEVLTSLIDFEHVYGPGTQLSFANGVAPPNFMWHAVRAFFANGGKRLCVVGTSSAANNPPEAPEYAVAFAALASVQEIAIVAAPGSTCVSQYGGRPDARALAQANAQGLLAHADATRDRIAVVDSCETQTTSDVRNMRATLDSSFAALYYPWVRTSDPASGGDLHVPPSGFIAGVYARVDLTRGVHTAPANESLYLATGLERNLAQAEAQTLNKSGVNLLRQVAGADVRVWGARTLASDPEWKYVNIRRLFIFLEQSIARGTQWAVFEPNAEPLWNEVRREVENFLTLQWRFGALAGARLDDAFFVKCDRTTMTQNDIDTGRLICLVGVAPVRPAEFVIFRIGQWTADRKTT
jgi:Bacteriophage tail sheath protein